MKKTILMLQLVLFMSAAFAGQFNFASPQFINFRINGSYPFFTEDVNQDKIPDLVATLYKGTNQGFYDSTVVPGNYLCIQDSMHQLRPVYKFSESILNGWEDVNNDGKKDVIFGKIDSVIIYYRIDSTHFNRKAIFLNAGAQAINLKIIDFNNNGTLDFVTRNYYQSAQTSPCLGHLLIQPVVDSFVLVPIISNATYGRTGEVIAGHFNTDNKTDFLVYFPNYFSSVYKKAYLYTQTSNYQFSIRILYLDNPFLKLISFDKNKDGIDDIAVEYFENNRRYLNIRLKTTDSFMSEAMITKLDSSTFPSNDPYLLQALDLNCDGSHEMIRASSQDIGHQFIYDSRYDSLYQSPTKMMISGPDIRFKCTFMRFADYDLDGRKDIIMMHESGQIVWSKNTSYNYLSNQQYLYSTYDTVYAEVLNKYGNLKYRTFTIPTDTTIRQAQINGGKKINPISGLLDDYKIIVSFREVIGNTYYYYLKNILKNDYKIITGNMCGVAIQDTMYETYIYSSINEYFDTAENEIISSTPFKRDTIFLSTSNIQETPKTNFAIYPNPVGDQFIIKGCTQTFPLRLWNALGQSFVLEPILPGEYDASPLPEGYYQAVVYDQERMLTLPILIQR